MPEILNNVFDGRISFFEDQLQQNLKVHKCKKPYTILLKTT